jgi:hypothetical protein
MNQHLQGNLQDALRPELPRFLPRPFRSGEGRGEGSPSGLTWKVCRPEASAQKPLCESSARSAMSIARLPRGHRAPLGAACCVALSREPLMPLLTELDTNPAARGYRHAAPDGAIPSAQEFEALRQRESLARIFHTRRRRGVGRGGPG